MGYFRVGEDGRLHVISKSEHYHAAVGHAFPGYALLERARSLGIPQATHNNTRGAVTRRLEEELIRSANGLSAADDLDAVLRSDEPTVLNRVLNLRDRQPGGRGGAETRPGSLLSARARRA